MEAGFVIFDPLGRFVAICKEEVTAFQMIKNRSVAFARESVPDIELSDDEIMDALSAMGSILFTYKPVNYAENP